MQRFNREMHFFQKSPLNLHKNNKKIFKETSKIFIKIFFNIFTKNFYIRVFFLNFKGGGEGPYNQNNFFPLDIGKINNFLDMA